MTESVAAEVIRRLLQRRWTVATAESLTGGLLGSLLTAVPGASAVYRGGVIAYATDLKASLGRVSGATLHTYGPVAAATAAELAEGARSVCLADWGLALTGVAGPEPQEGHPVGQVYVGLAGPDRPTQVRELSLGGSRASIRQHAAEQALMLLKEALAGPPDEVSTRGRPLIDPGCR